MECTASPFLPLSLPPSIHSPNTIKYCLERYMSSIKYNWYSCIYSIRVILRQKGKEYKSGSEKAAKKSSDLLRSTRSIPSRQHLLYRRPAIRDHFLHFHCCNASEVCCHNLYAVIYRNDAPYRIEYKEILFWLFLFFWTRFFRFARKVPFFWQQTYFIAVFLCFLYRYFTIIPMYKYILYIGIMVRTKSMHYSIAIASCFRGCLDGLLPSLSIFQRLFAVSFSLSVCLLWNEISNLSSLLFPISSQLALKKAGSIFIHFFSYNKVCTAK